MVQDCIWGVSLWYRTAHGKLVYGTGLHMGSLSMVQDCTWGVSLWYRTAHGELVYGTGLHMRS